MITQQDIDHEFFSFLNSLDKDRIGEDFKKNIEKAYYFAKEKHKNQKRISGEPYISHPVKVAKLVYSNFLGTHSIITSLLHDTVEDCNVSLKEIKKEFGSEVRDLVESLTKISSFGEKKVKSGEIDQLTLRKILISSIKDIRVLVIKLCDRLHNIQTLKDLSEEKKLRIANETLELYVPIAQKVGLYNIKWELEDLCLKYTNPDFFAFIKEKIGVKIDVREKFIKEIESKVDKVLRPKISFKYSMYGRCKNFYSIYKKIKDKAKSFEDLYDLYAIRILTKSIEECYILFGIIQANFRTHPGKIKDYIANPKSNGYQSIHTVIFLEGMNTPVEIQIRTEDMNKIAEYGIAAHYRYKKLGFDMPIFERKITWLREIFNFEKENDLNIDLVNLLRSDFFDEEIFVFTPKNKLILLPEDSIVLDFAYAIHTDIGNFAQKAKVNGEIASLDKKLKNGDNVLIYTNKAIRQSSRYLGLLKSTKAKVKLRQLLNMQHSGKIDNFNRERVENLLKEILDIEKFRKKRIGFCCHDLTEEDSIIGILRKNELVIHKSDCKTAKENLSSKIHLRWRNAKTIVVKKIKILFEDRVGLITEILHIFNTYNIKIEDLKIKSLRNNNYQILLNIEEGKYFERCFDEIKDLDSVISVEKMKPLFRF